MKKRNSGELMKKEKIGLRFYKKVFGEFPLAFKQAGVSEANGMDINPTWIEGSKALAGEITLKCHAIGKTFWIPMTSMNIESRGRNK